MIWLDEPSDKQVCFRSKAASSQSRLDLMESEGLFCDTDCVGKRDRARELVSRLVSTVAVHVHLDHSIGPRVLIKQGRRHLMQISGNFSVSGVDAARTAGRTPPAQSATASAATITTPVDQLDLSPEALSSASSQPSGEVFRSDKVASLREAIAQGNYDTDEKLSVALDKLLDQLG